MVSLLLGGSSYFFQVFHFPDQNKGIYTQII